MKDYEILMGACGWEHAAWQDQYYPQDLPPEWRLAYYGNEFPVVLIPQDYWRADSEQIQAWIDETEERPQFIAEMPGPERLQAQGLSEAQWIDKLNLLGTRVLGVCVRIDDANTPLPSLAGLAPTLAVCIQADPGVPETALERLAVQAGRAIGCCWNGQGAPDCLHEGALAIARVDSNRIEPRQLRSVVEACRAAGSEDRTVVLLADGDPPNLETLRNAEVMAQLL